MNRNAIEDRFQLPRPSGGTMLLDSALPRAPGNARQLTIAQFQRCHNIGSLSRYENLFARLKKTFQTVPTVSDDRRMPRLRRVARTGNSLTAPWGDG